MRPLAYSLSADAANAADNVAAAKSQINWEHLALSLSSCSTGGVRADPLWSDEFFE